MDAKEQHERSSEPEQQRTIVKERGEQEQFASNDTKNKNAHGEKL